MGSLMVSRHCVGREVYRLERASKNGDDLFSGRQRRGIHFSLNLGIFLRVLEAPETLKFASMNGQNVELENIIF
jgi:hypothetical protein